jgi:hypothetical protein
MAKRSVQCFNPAMSEPVKSDRTPMMLSAFVCPGAGQFLQKRWIAGALYSVLFTIFSLILVFEVFKPMFHNINAALNWAAAPESDQPFEGISLTRLAVSFVAVIVVYIANIVDVQHANRKRLQPPPLPLA